MLAFTVDIVCMHNGSLEEDYSEANPKLAGASYCSGVMYVKIMGTVGLPILLYISHATYKIDALLLLLWIPHGLRPWA
jgi:hypothetical protein